MEQVTKLLEQLASKLGTTAEQLWQVLLQQVEVEIVLCNLWMGIWLWGGIGCIVLAIIMLIFAIKINEDGLGGFSLFVIVVVLIVSTLGYLANYTELITLTKNPEYWALQEILKNL